MKTFFIVGPGFNCGPVFAASLSQASETACRWLGVLALPRKTVVHLVNDDHRT